jgi:hypothetical protein
MSKHGALVAAGAKKSMPVPKADPRFAKDKLKKFSSGARQPAVKAQGVVKRKRSGSEHDEDESEEEEDVCAFVATI